MDILSNGMYQVEKDNFFALDNKEYILKDNKDFMKWYNEKIKQGFYSILTIEQLQDMIEKVVLFFEIKYHSKFLSECLKCDKSEEYYKAKDIAKKMDINQLKYRLYHDYVQFLECSYCCYINLRKPKENIFDLSKEFIKIYKDGTIDKYDLESLKENGYVHDIEGIKTVSDLLGYFLSNPTKVDYSELENLVFNHKTKLELRNKILELITLAMLYSRNSLPIYGYVRAKSFIRMMNKEYKLNLNTFEIDEIMSINYKEAPSNSDKEKFIKRKVKRFEN